jgi:hypothetical protein
VKLRHERYRSGSGLAASKLHETSVRADDEALQHWNYQLRATADAQFMVFRILGDAKPASGWPAGAVLARDAHFHMRQRRTDAAMDAKSKRRAHLPGHLTISPHKALS